MSTSSLIIDRARIIALVSLLLIATGLPGLAAYAQEPDKKAQAEKPDEFQQTMTNARNILRQGMIEDAIAEFQKAAKLRDLKCAECFQSIGQIYFQLGKLKEAAIAFRQCVDLKPANQAEIYNILGVALYLQNEKQSYEDAAEALQRAIELSGGKVTTAYYNLGFALIKSGKEEAGINALRKYLELEPNATEASQARAVIENTKMTDVRVAPFFVAKSHTGAELSLEKERGKIVLLDFWASWCLPCRADLPEVKKIWKKYGGDQFVIIGINLDSNRPQFDGYLKEEGLSWPQYYDGLGWNNKIARLYNVYSIPHTVLIDQQGVIRSTGLRGEELSTQIADLIEKLRAHPSTKTAQ
jgi:tetratricopeptide (TPR) repeat protein